MSVISLNIVALLCIIFPLAEMTTHRPESSTELKLAILNASPGDTISLLPEDYHGDFAIFRSGSKNHPIKIIGTKDKYKSTHIIAKRRGFDVKGDYWVIENMSIKSSDVGVELSGRGNWLKDLFINGAVRGIIMEGEDNRAVGITYPNSGPSPVPPTTTTEYFPSFPTTTSRDCSGWRKIYHYCWG
jgi:hypothetical protein